MNLKEFEKSLVDPKPVYFAQADQEFLSRKVFELCRKQVPDSAEAFDWAVFDIVASGSGDKARSAAETEAVGVARTMPWMSPRRWVYVRGGEAASGELIDYMRDPSQRTVLVVEVSGDAFWRKHKKTPELNSIPVIKMPDRPNTVGWIKRRAEEEGFKVLPGAAESLLELVGDDFQRLNSELERLFLVNFDARKIGKEQVLEIVFQTRESNIFDLIGAIANQRPREALGLLTKLLDAGVATQQVTTMLYWNFRRLLAAHDLLESGQPFPAVVRQLKIWSYRNREREVRRTSRQQLVDILIRLREVDKQSKTTSWDEKLALERLVIDTCRVASV
jgi:DNA polymerase-3 subunit delta